VAVMKADHVQIKTDMREVRTLLDKSADRQGVILRAVMTSLVTTLLSALAFVLWQVYTHPHGFA
jgi:predicted secreted protein